MILKLMVSVMDSFNAIYCSVGLDFFIRVAQGLCIALFLGF